jgi:hypothetical protein
VLIARAPRGYARFHLHFAGAQVAREPRHKAETADADGRIAPDPFAAVLPALAALATIASIAAVNWVGQDKVGERSRTRRKAGIALRDLESCRKFFAASTAIPNCSWVRGAPRPHP